MANNAIILPASDRGWVLYAGGQESARATEPGELPGARSGAAVGIPSATISLFSVTLPKTDSSLHESMIFSQVEKRGLENRQGPTVFDFQRVGENEEGEVFSVTVVVSLPPELEISGSAGYAPAAALRSHPTDGAAIWLEQGRVVFGVFMKGVPMHLEVLSALPESGSAIATDIKLALLGLAGQPEFGRGVLDRLFVVSPPISAEVLDSLQRSLTIPTETLADGIDVRAQLRPRMLPASVERAAKRKRAAKRNTAILVAGLVVYAVIISWLWIQARSTRREIDSLERRVAIVEPDVQHIQMIEERWKQLSPAFDKSKFPVVQLSRITSALPVSGVVVREYRTTGQTIRIRGQARDVQLANRLLEDLKGMDFFSAYEWSMPNPKVEQNNTATFEIEGKPRYASADS